jgi:hypothetical protein
MPHLLNNSLRLYALAGMNAGCDKCVGFAKQNLKPKNGMDAIFWQRKG